MDFKDNLSFRYNKPDDHSSKKSAKVTASSEAPAFDFTKIETLFSNSTTTSTIDKPECEEEDDNRDEVKVPSDEVCFDS